MHNLDKLFNRIQMRQATGKAIEEVKDQLVQQAVQMEEAHKELADTLVKVRLMDMMQELEGGPIQKYRARVTKLKRTT